MGNKTKPLSDTEIRSAKIKVREYNLADGRGLQLRVRPNGSKIWLLNYKSPITGKRTNIGLGQYPTVSLSFARQRRNESLTLIAQGKDPKQFRLSQNTQSEEHIHTLKSVSLQWLEVKKASITEGYFTDITRSLELHIFPALGATELVEIKPKMVIETLAPLAAKGSLETVRRLCQRLNEVMTYAVNIGLIEFNTLSGVKAAFASPKRKHQPSIPPQMLPELLKRIFRANIRHVTRQLIMWQLHTMVRPSEAAGARWDEIDWENRLWVIPGSRMKKGVEHKVPLTHQAMSILSDMKQISAHLHHIFPADRGKSEHANPQSANMALKRMGFQGQLVAHGLRSLASTTLNEAEFSPDLIEAALAHLDKNEVRRAYNRTDYINQRKQMMEFWSDHIQRSISF
ncbi:Prophage CP4-57 integrase [Grimontia celer]|uniref:Prophage CP4-57 integrase n=1 Tax=Grimontia celer TaxID=1796497 RepID=A0A128ETC0_9GAMM|nr:integrase domain-containing protein [Grimontia celer]CZF77206.1 Prophage CP4-57 integrase [Grimontia celer]